MFTIKNKGFTLIELMVALVILSILMGFAIPEVMKQINQGKEETRDQNLRMLNKAIQSYFNTRGEYPSTLGSLEASLMTVKGRDIVLHPYFEEIPINPVTNSSDWIVTNKTNWINGQKFFTQQQFAVLYAADPKKEGIYRSKANRKAE